MRMPGFLGPVADEGVGGAALTGGDDHGDDEVDRYEESAQRPGASSQMRTTVLSVDAL
jgi:hypothetical protein